MKPFFLVVHADLFVADDLREIIRTVVPEAEVGHATTFDEATRRLAFDRTTYAVFFGGDGPLQPQDIGGLIDRQIAVGRIDESDDLDTRTPWERIVRMPFTNESVAEVLQDWLQRKPLTAVR